MSESLRAVAVEMVMRGDLIPLLSCGTGGSHDLLCVTSIHEGLDGISLTGYRMMLEGMMYTTPPVPYGTELSIFN